MSLSDREPWFLKPADGFAEAMGALALLPREAIIPPVSAPVAGLVFNMFALYVIASWDKAMSQLSSRDRFAVHFIADQFHEADTPLPQDCKIAEAHRPSVQEADRACQRFLRKMGVVSEDPFVDLARINGFIDTLVFEPPGEVRDLTEREAALRQHILAFANDETGDACATRPPRSRLCRNSSKPST